MALSERSTFIFSTKNVFPQSIIFISDEDIYVLFLVQSIRTYTDNNLQATYLSAPSLDLEASIKCVQEPTDPLRRYMILVCIPNKESGILSQTELAAIKVYTMDAVYVPLNAALRSRNSKNIQPWFPYLKIFHNAVKKLSTTNRLLCFGERTNWIASEELGSIVTWVNSSSYVHAFPGS